MKDPARRTEINTATMAMPKRIPRGAHQARPVSAGHGGGHDWPPSIGTPSALETARTLANADSKRVPLANDRLNL